MVIPRYASTYSAFGMLNMEVGRDFARSIIVRAKALDLARLNALFGEMEVEAREVLGSLGIAPADVLLRRSVELRYLGQFHEVEVTDVPAGPIGPGELAAIVEAFQRRHRDLFTFNMPKREVEFLNARVKGTARREPVPLAEIPQAAGDAAGALKRRRPCLWDPARGYEDTPVYDGSRLAAGHELAGPAVIEERTTTVVVPASFTCRVDRWKNYILSRR